MRAGGSGESGQSRIQLWEGRTTHCRQVVHDPDVESTHGRNHDVRKTVGLWPDDY